jgi:4-hydroxy-2-oxoheptanedioate aldolase
MTVPYALAQHLRAGESVFLSWVGMTDPLFAEVVARSKFGAVNLDMQHGWHDPLSVMNCIGSVVSAGKPAVVRVPVGDFSAASRALDMGAEAIIAPMINTPEDARALVEAVKYPPLGKRSWGPARAMALGKFASPNDYLRWANDNVLAFAMIETRQAIDNLDAILDVPGIDGIFVGPADLSLTLSNGDFVDGLSSSIHEPVAHILAAAKAKRKIPAMFGVSAPHSKSLVAAGYQLVSIGTDAGFVTKGCNDLVDAASSGLFQHQLQPSDVGRTY